MLVGSETTVFLKLLRRSVGAHALAFMAAAGLSLGACSLAAPTAAGAAGLGGSANASGMGGSSVPAGGGGGRVMSEGTSCSNGVPCGGDLVGTWTVTSSCLDIGGELGLSLVGTGCLSAQVAGSLHVTGTWTANADGTYADNTTTTGEVKFTLAPSCLVISSTPVSCDGAASVITSLGFESLACKPAADGGCQCSGTVNHSGSLGLLSVAPSTTGNYAISSNVVTITGDAGDAKYSYCATSDMLSVSPQSTSATLTGTLALHKASGPAAAGAAGGTGEGGAPGSGGGLGSGGLVGISGNSGVAGMHGSGGSTAGLSGAGGSSGSSGTTASGGAAAGGSAGANTGPCDIYKQAGNPCVAAHSTVRALFGAYGGKLYQVRNSAGSTEDIPALTPGGFADGAAQDAFCAGTTCVITVVYDQAGKGNDLWYQGSTQVPGSTSSSPAKATTEALTLSGHKVYSLYVNPGNSYWVDASKSGIALGAEPEGMYLVTSSKHYNSGCCFDYGNSETDRKADGSGAMDALNFSSITAWGSGAGNGPWIMADLEYGVFAQNNTNKNQNDPTQTSTYVTAVLKNDGKTQFALRGGNASAGSLGTYYKGALPGGWSPMQKQGAIVLGSGGDCCKPGGGANLSDGTFYEGCIVTGYPSDATEDAVQANVVAAGYGK